MTVEARHTPWACPLVLFIKGKTWTIMWGQDSDQNSTCLFVRGGPEIMHRIDAACFVYTPLALSIELETMDLLWPPLANEFLSLFLSQSWGHSHYKLAFLSGHEAPPSSWAPRAPASLVTPQPDSLVAPRPDSLGPLQPCNSGAADRLAAYYSNQISGFGDCLGTPVSMVG